MKKRVSGEKSELFAHKKLKVEKVPGTLLKNDRVYGSSLATTKHTQALKLRGNAYLALIKLFRIFSGYVES